MPDSPANDKQVEQELKVQIHPQHQIVQISTRGRLDIRAHDAYIPFDTLDMIYCGVLQARMAMKKGQAVTLDQMHQQNKN